MTIDKEKEELFRKVRSRLGAGVRAVELTDDILCNLLSMCVEDYAEKVQHWIVENQWASLYGKNISSTDMAFALSVRTLDYMKDYSYWFSKEVGLQQRGPWELKKDFVEVEKGKQVYMIPAGREINKVLYTTPPTSQAALFANYAGIDVGFGGGYAQIGGGGVGSGPIGGFYTMPAYDTVLLSADLAYKNKLLRSDLTYKVTAGPNGTKLLHLLSTPGSNLSFGFSGPGVGVGAGLWGMVGCQVWYTYYDVNPGEEDECRKQNPDILISPDQVPLENMDYSFLNSPTKTIIRQLLVASAAHTLGFIRGKNSGKISIPMAELQMDYQMLLSFGLQEKDNVMKSLEERLMRMSPAEVMKKQAEIVEASMQAKRGVPLGLYVI